uniref:Uncharacterized protein n=1 Tax=Pelusios castaneus TaxID=367368 RepID=A0A8C8SR63_9SAUR
MAAPTPSGSGKSKPGGPEHPAPTSLAGRELDDAICRICQEYLTDPVTLECGHNFCRECITCHCAREETSTCPQCGEKVQKRDFKSNVQLGSLVQTIKELGLKPAKRRRKEGKVCAEHGKEFLWFCKEDGKSLCEDCKGSPAHRSHSVIPMGKASQQATSQQEKRLVLYLGVPVNDRTSNQVTPPSSTWEITHYLLDVSKRQCFPSELACFPLTGTRVNFPLIFPSPAPDWKRVKHGDKCQDLPDTPVRFDYCVSVLGAEQFTGGRCYWEVEVGDKTEWDLGVTLTPEDGYWAVLLRNGEYKACTSSWDSRPVSVRPSRVGIFLDYEAGEVSFYNVTDGSHLFTFTDTFSGTLHPFFYTGLNAGGANAAPLIICPIPAQAGGNL